MSHEPRNSPLLETLKWVGRALVIVGILVALPLVGGGSIRPEQNRASILLGLFPLAVGALMLTLLALRSHRLLVVLILCMSLPIGGYVSAYQLLGKVDDYPEVVYRTYNSRLKCRLFSPLAWLESKWRDDVVILEVPVDYDPTGHLHDGPVVVLRP